MSTNNQRKTIKSKSKKESTVTEENKNISGNREK